MAGNTPSVEEYDDFEIPGVPQPVDGSPYDPADQIQSPLVHGNSGPQATYAGQSEPIVSNPAAAIPDQGNVLIEEGFDTGGSGGNGNSGNVSAPGNSESSGKKGPPKMLIIGGAFLIFMIIAVGGAAVLYSVLQSQATPPRADSPEAESPTTDEAALADGDADDTGLDDGADEAALVDGDADSSTDEADIEDESGYISTDELSPGAEEDEPEGSDTVASTWEAAVAENPQPESGFVLSTEEPTDSRAISLATALGLTEDDLVYVEDAVTYVQSDESVEPEFSYTIDTGTLSYTNEEGWPLPPVEDTAEAVITLLKQLSLYDSSMTITATYQNEGTPGVTYYELHRDWDFLEMPVLYVPELSFLQETETMYDLTYHINPLTDEAIIETTDNTDGQARPDSFNTITVGVRGDETVYSIDSTMRKVSGVQRDIALIDAEAAVTALRAGSYETLIPDMSGLEIDDPTAFEIDYTEFASDVEVREAIVALIEEPIDQVQTDMSPHWVLKGTGIINGLEVPFIATVRAIDDGSESTPAAE